MMKKDIVSSFEVSDSIYTEIKEHFNQAFVAKDWNINTKSKRMKKCMTEFFKNHATNIVCMEVLNNEKFIVTGGDDGAVRISDLNGEQNCILQKHKSAVTSIAVDLKDSLLISGSCDCTVRLWDLELKKQVWLFRGHNEAVNSVLISQEGHFALSGSADRRIILWDIKNKKLLRMFEFEYDIYCMKLVKEEQNVVAVGQDGKITIRSLKGHNCHEADTGRDSIITCIQFDDKEKHFIIGDDNGILQIWKTKTFKKIFESKKHSERITQISFTKNSHLFASCSLDTTFIIWDFKKHKPLKISEYNTQIMSIKFLKSRNILIMCLANSQFYQIDYTNKHKIKEKATQILVILGITISRDFNYLAYGNKEINLVDFKRMEKINMNSEYKYQITCLVFSKDSNSLACAVSKKVIILKVPSLVEIKIIKLDFSPIICLACSESKKFVSCSDRTENFAIFSMEENKTVVKKNIRIWDTEFCLNDENLLCLEFPHKIHVFGKSLEEIKVIQLNYFISSFIVSEDGSKLLISYFKCKWSCVDLEKFDLEFENKHIEDAKKWCVDRKDLKCLTYTRMPEISMH